MWCHWPRLFNNFAGAVLSTWSFPLVRSYLREVEQVLEDLVPEASGIQLRSLGFSWCCQKHLRICLFLLKTPQIPRYWDLLKTDWMPLLKTRIPVSTLNFKSLKSNFETWHFEFHTLVNLYAFVNHVSKTHVMNSLLYPVFTKSESHALWQWWWRWNASCAKRISLARFVSICLTIWNTFSCFMLIGQILK